MIEALILTTIILYAAAVGAHFFVGKKTGMAVFLLGAVLNFALVFHRWAEAGHLPFSNMYETMLSLGACIYLLHLLTEFGLKVNAPWMDPLLAAVVVTGAYFRDRDIAPLMPALQSPLFFPHVFTYILSYAAMAKGCVLAVCALSVQKELKPAWERSSYRVICLGFPLLTAGLLLGAVWAKLAWGDYWSWDPKEMWSFITWMTYIGYFHVRHRKGPRHSLVAWLAVLGFVMVVATLLWVNLSRIFSGGLHSYA